jgi:diguanylate cyclase (GGDEF)-like protein
VVITLLTSQLIRQQYESIEQKKLDTIAEDNEPTLGLNISYGFDKAITEIALDIYSDPNILYVSVQSQNGDIITRTKDKKTFHAYQELRHFTTEKNISDPITQEQIGSLRLVYSRALFDEMILRYNHKLSIIIAVYLFVIIMIAYLLRRTTAPLSSLAHQMIAFDPNNPKLFDFNRKDKSEIGLISNAANAMVSSIESYLDTLKKLKNNLIQREAHLNDAQRMAHVGSWEYNIEEDRFEMSQELLRIFGLNSRYHNARWETFLDYTIEEDKAYLVSSLEHAIEKGGRFNLRYRCQKSNGEILNIHTQGKVRKKSDLSTRITGVSMDVTEQHLAQQMIEKLAYYDALTELPNRVLFKNRLTKAIASSKRNKELIGVLFIDLDRFKLINDSLGHMIGDELLKYVSKSLLASLREEDTVSRLGGDEFTILVPAVKQISDLELIAKKLISNLNKRLHIGKHELYISMSIGIACYPDHGLNADELLKNSDTAMYKAKELGRNNYQFYQTQMGSYLKQQLGIEQEFRKAVLACDKSLKLYFQPKLDFKTLRVTGAEALIRWEHSEHGLLFPDSFIPLAESTGLILDLGAWIIEEAISQVASWQKQFSQHLQVSINLSARQFQDSTLIPLIRGLIQKYDVDPVLLEFEITESISMSNIADNLVIMGELKSLGVGLAIDDFGTGYSSLAYLKQFPVDTLKIDKSFVMDMLEDDDDKVIVSTIISMAKALGLKTVAEGVETQAHQYLLQELNCDTAQGYFYAKALDTKSFVEFVASHQ